MRPSTARDLKAVPLFATLSETDREFLASQLDPLDFGAGHILIKEGKGNHTFFVLQEGSAEVSVDGKPRRMLGPGDFFGEISMDQHVPATATVVAKTPVRTYVMSQTQFRAVKANEGLLLRLRAAMGERLLADRQG
jgi:CRP-like cAMP-binding protein